MVNPNPIQQVLQAERDAGEAVEKAREESAAAIAAARRLAYGKPHYQMVVMLLAIIVTLVLRPSGFFGKQKQLEEREAQVLREHAARDIASRRALAESQLQQLVEEIYAERWPKS